MLDEISPNSLPKKCVFRFKPSNPFLQTKGLQTQKSPNGQTHMVALRLLHTKLAPFNAGEPFQALGVHFHLPRPPRIFRCLHDAHVQPAGRPVSLATVLNPFTQP